MFNALPILLLLQITSPPEELLQQGGTKYLKVPVPYDQVLSETNMRDTCLEAHLKPLCWSADPNHIFSSSECSVGNLPEMEDDKNANHFRLAKHLCSNPQQPSDCPVLDHVFFFRSNWTSTENEYLGASGVIINSKPGIQQWIAFGTNYKSGYNRRPLYAVCVQQPGKSLLGYKTFFSAKGSGFK